MSNLNDIKFAALIAATNKMNPFDLKGILERLGVDREIISDFQIEFAKAKAKCDEARVS